MSKKQKEEKPLTEEQAAKRAAGIAASAERKARAAQKVTKGQTDATAATALVPAERDSVTVPGAIDYASMDTVTFHASAVAAVDELRDLSDQCGLVIYTKILPALTDAKRRFDAGEEVNGCNGIEQYIESFGIKPATVRKWKQRAAERELSKQVRLLTGETPKPKTKPLAYNRKQKERLLAAASIVGSELIPAYENGHDISEPMAELKKIAFDSEELTSIVDVPEKRENPLALSLARHVKRVLTELFTVRQGLTAESELSRAVVKQVDVKSATPQSYGLSEGQVGAIITSPPYLCMADYALGLRLSYGWLLPGLLKADFEREIGARRLRLKKNKSDIIIREYCQALNSFANLAGRVVRKGGFVAVVLGQPVARQYRDAQVLSSLDEALKENGFESLWHADRAIHWHRNHGYARLKTERISVHVKV